jgi:(E)-4-hydroxy-3-methylbut-2-enyl-diphosphate synthase
VADAFDKIRVNPGNFADGRKSFKEIKYETREEYQEELDYIEEMFTPLVLKCKELGRAMRIGTNHGSLSARTLSYFGDTPAGMVESAFEFARICRKNDYHNFLFSMKASNPKVMVAAYRLLAAEMYDLGWDYPMHLGVTEAGEGEDGRMKSAIGIGSLLQDGLGDTIRVSLTEDPWLELDPCKKLKAIADKQRDTIWTPTPTWKEETRDFKAFTQRIGQLPLQKEGDKIDVRNVLHRDGSVISAVTLAQLANPDKLYMDLGCKTAVGMPFKDIATSDSIFLRKVPPKGADKERLALKRMQEVGVGVLAPAQELTAAPIPNAIAVFALSEVAKGEAKMPEGAMRMAISVRGDESDAEMAKLKGSGAVMLLVETPKGNYFSNVLYIVTLHSKQTRTLTFENVWKACRGSTRRAASSTSSSPTTLTRLSSTT